MILKKTQRTNVINSQEQNWQNSNLQRCLRYILVLAQVFGVFPLSGVTKNVEDLKFSWKSPRTLYTGVAIFFVTLYTVFMVYYCSKHGENIFGYNFNNAYWQFLFLVIFIWNLRGLCGVLACLKAAYLWPALMQQWNKMERCMSFWDSPPNLSIRFRIIGFLYLFLGTTEHSIFISSGISRVVSMSTEKSAFVKTYFITTYLEFYTYAEFSYWHPIILQGMSFVTTFTWQFLNYFLIIMSSALALRFRQISLNLSRVKEIDENLISRVRLDYNRLSLLCDQLNEALGEVILVAFAGNLYFTSVVFYQSLKVKQFIEVDVFYYFNTCFIYFHMLMLCLYTSWVYEESTQPVIYLMSFPTTFYPEEVERILDQVTSKPVAIHARNIFTVTRSIVIEIASAIIVIQLLFLSFDT